MRSYESELLDHLSSFFADHAWTMRTWESEQLAHLNPDFRVVEFGPGPRSSAWTYISVGAGREASENGRRLEFILCARQAAERHVHLLHMVAHYHLTGETLDVGHMFSLGEPWLAGSRLDCMMISVPYPFGPELEVFTSGDHHAHLLWLMPITSAEREFARGAGAEALEAELEKHSVDFIDPSRPSVIHA